MKKALVALSILTLLAIGATAHAFQSLQQTQRGIDTQGGRTTVEQLQPAIHPHPVAPHGAHRLQPASGDMQGEQAEL